MPSSRKNTTSGGKRRLVIAAWTTSIVLLLGLILIGAHFGQTKRFLELIGHLALGWVLAAILLQAATYLCAAAVWVRALAGNRIHRSIRSLLPLGLAKLFMDQAVPSAGLSGTILVVRGLVHRGISRRAATVAVVVGLAGFYLASGLTVAAALAILWLGGDLNRKFVWLSTPILFFATAIPIGVLWMRARGARRTPSWLRRLPLFAHLAGGLGSAPRPKSSNRRVLLETTSLQLAIFLLDAATLGAALWAVGAHARLTSLFASFVIAFLVGSITLLPGGIGSFDGTCVAMLHWAGVPFEESLAATLAYRGFTLLLPLPLGLWLARREMS